MARGGIASSCRKKALTLPQLIFLSPESIPLVIDNVQDKTKRGGVNLIVAPVSSPDFACPIDFPFTFSPNELKEFYSNWSILNYDENVGEFHLIDENGNRYKSTFASIIAGNDC